MFGFISELLSNRIAAIRRATKSKPTDAPKTKGKTKGGKNTPRDSDQEESEESGGKEEAEEGEEEEDEQTDDEKENNEEEEADDDEEEEADDDQAEVAPSRPSTNKDTLFQKRSEHSINIIDDDDDEEEEDAAPVKSGSSQQRRDSSGSQQADRARLVDKRAKASAALVSMVSFILGYEKHS